MVTRRLRHPIPDQRHRAHADGKRAEQAAFFVPADEQGGEGGDKEQVIPGDVELAVREQQIGRDQRGEHGNGNEGEPARQERAPPAA